MTFTKGQIKQVLAPYLNENSKISISYLKKSITIKNYKINLIKDESLILNYLNKCFEQFKFDKVITKTNQIIFKAEKTPVNFTISPKKQKKGVITIGRTEDGDYLWMPGLNNSIALLMPPGVGKTHTLKHFLKNIELYHLGNQKTFEEIIIIDLKQEDDFIFLSSNPRVKFCNNQTETESVLAELERKAEANTARPTLVLCEEYVQAILGGDKKIGKNIARILQKIHTFMRSKNIAIIITTQFLQSEENEIRVDNFIKILSSPPENFAQIHSIPKTYCHRSDLVRGRYLISFKGATKCIRMN